MVNGGHTPFEFPPFEKCEYIHAGVKYIHVGVEYIHVGVKNIQAGV